MSTENNIHVIKMSNYVRPKLVENKTKDWVMNGRNNEFYQYIIDRHNGSPTNAAINNSYIDLIYGKGLSLKQGTPEDFLAFMSIINPKEVKKIVSDFQIFGEASIRVAAKKGKDQLPTLYHIAKQKVIPSIENEDCIIENYWYSKDWTKQFQPENKPEPFPSFGTAKRQDQIYVIKPYRAGKEYFSDPDYLSGLQYAELEEEISNFSINHIKNGLSFGYIINFPVGDDLGIEEKRKLKKEITDKLTGSSNAGNIVMNFSSDDKKITVEAVVVNDAHKQWDFLTDLAEDKILRSHKATSPSLVGIIKTTGFASTADEMDTAEAQLMKRVIAPKQDYILSAFEEICMFYGLNLKLGFKPLTDQKENIVQAELSKKKEPEINVDKLISLGEVIGDDYVIVEEDICNEMTLNELQLNNIIELAQVPRSSNKKSDQDTSLFKIRYRYAGEKNGERDFCNKVISANKVYRSEDLNANYNYNEDFAPKGKDSYNIFLYKGGVNCKHFWERVIYLKKDNKKITVNQARKMILELDPKDRRAARWNKNDKKVAQSASASNNYWSLQPNYRK